MFKGGSLHDGFGGFDGSGEQLALLLLALQNTVPRDDHDGFDGFGGFGRDGYPLNSTPLFRHPERCASLNTTQQHLVHSRLK